MDYAGCPLLHWLRRPQAYGAEPMGVSALDLKELEDSTLMAWVVEGRHGALEVLYDRYADLVYSFALRMLGETTAARELVLTVYLRVWQEARTFEPHRGSFLRWLLSQTHQLGIAKVRQKRAQAPSSPDMATGNTLSGDHTPDVLDPRDTTADEYATAVAPSLPSDRSRWPGPAPISTSDPAPSGALDLDDAIAHRRKRINEALALLSGEQRRAVELAYFDGRTQEEIGVLTGEPPATIRSRIRLSLRKLREVLHPEDVEVGLA
jgi:RNA polymerase sigma-70 factor (ECF subfamily)